MATQSNIHFFTNWAKERLDEMDAAVTSLEGKLAEVQSDARDKADKVLADLRKQRDDFQGTIRKQSEFNEAAWLLAKAKLELDWKVFEAELKKYVESFGKKIEHQQATFKVDALRTKSEQTAEEHWVQDALEDDEVREALKCLHARGKNHGDGLA